MKQKTPAAPAAFSTSFSDVRPLLRPCKSDIENLIRLHSIKDGLGSAAEKAAEARSLLSQHGPLVGVYPCWHPIRRFLMHQEQKPALAFNPSLPHDPFDHGRRFQWAIVGWPYNTNKLLHDYVFKHRDDLARFNLIAEVAPSVLYGGGAQNAIIIKVEPLMVRYYQGLSDDGWRAVIQSGYLEASMEYARQNRVTMMEAYSYMQADYFGAKSEHPGLHGRFHEALDDHLIDSLAAWHYAFQYRLIQANDAEGDVPREAYKKLIEDFGDSAHALVSDALIAARSI
jgi:hypothetical protein